MGIRRRVTWKRQLYPDNPNVPNPLYPIDCKALPFIEKCQMTGYDVANHEMTVGDDKKMDVSCDAWWLLGAWKAKCDVQVPHAFSEP